MHRKKGELIYYFCILDITSLCNLLNLETFFCRCAKRYPPGSSKTYHCHKFRRREPDLVRTVSLAFFFRSDNSRKKKMHSITKRPLISALQLYVLLLMSHETLSVERLPARLVPPQFGCNRIGTDKSYAVGGTWSVVPYQTLPTITFFLSFLSIKVKNI